MVFFLAGLVVLVAPQGAHAQATPVIDPATTIPGEAPTEEDSTFSAAAVGSIQFNQPSYTILSGTTATASLTITMTSTTTNGTVEIFGLASAIPVAPASVTPSGGGTCSFNQPPGGGTVQVFFGSSGAGSCVITFTISEDGSGFPNGTIVANSQVNFIPLNIVRATVSFVSPLSAGSPTFNIPFGTPYNGTLPVAGGKTPYTFSILSPPSTGSVTLTNAATGGFSFTPAPNQFGTSTFTFRVTDSTDVVQRATGTVSLVIAPPPVVANSGSLAVPYAGQADGVLDATGGDGTLTFSEDVPPQKGSVTIDPITGRYTYVASPGQTGGDSFTFRATDGSQPALSDTGRISVTIAPPPLIATNLDLDVAYEGSVSDTITTSGGTPPLTFVVANQPLKGTVMLDETTGAFTYDAGEGETGPDSFTATITDGERHRR